MPKFARKASKPAMGRIFTASWNNNLVDFATGPARLLFSRRDFSVWQWQSTRWALNYYTCIVVVHRALEILLGLTQLLTAFVAGERLTGSLNQFSECARTQLGETVRQKDGFN